MLTTGCADQQVLNDENDITKQASNFAELVATGGVDVLFSGSTVSVDRMYDASAPSEMMSIACCTGPESVYVNKTYLFGVHVNSEEYPVEYIRAARAQGARKIALLWHTGSGFTVSTCDSARATAEREGMTVVYTKSYDLAQTTQAEYDAMVAHPPLRLPPARAYAAPRARTRTGELRSRARLPACTALHLNASML